MNWCRIRIRSELDLDSDNEEVHSKVTDVED